MSVTEDDLPTVQTPTSPNVSPLDSLSVDSVSQNAASKHEDEQKEAAPSPNMPTIKVQPFIRGEVTCLPTANQEAPAALRSQLLSDFYLSTHKIKIGLLKLLFYVSTEEDFVKTWKSRLLSHRRYLLLALCLVVAVILALGIGLGGQFLVKYLIFIIIQ